MAHGSSLEPAGNLTAKRGPGKRGCMLTTADVGKLLRVSDSTLSRWRVRGEGPPFQRHGLGRVVYDEAEVRAWAKANRMRVWDDKEVSSAAS